MIELFTYLLKSTISITILYLAFDIFFKSRISFKFNRLLLLSIVFFGLTIPFINYNISNIIPMGNTYVETIGENEGMLTITLQEFVVNNKLKSPIFGISMPLMIGGIYIVIAIILVISLLIKLKNIWVIMKRSEVKKIDGFRFVLLEEDYPTFSFFNLVFINKDLFENKEESRSIIEHEAIHSYQKHTIDILLSELLIIVQWFNPISFMIRKSIKENHEFLADNGILESNSSIPDYKLLLLRNSTNIKTGSITHNFSYSLIKKRFKMMEKKESKMKFIMALMILPLAFSFAFYACSSPELNNDDSLAKPDTEAVEETKVVKDSIIKKYEQEQDHGAEIFTVVEVMPEFEGGINELYKFLGNNIKYPEQAKADSIQGRVFVNFVVNENGSVSNVKVLRGIGGGCDEEAVRVISMMPNWKPGTQRGKPVRVAYNLPIKFTLR